MTANQSSQNSERKNPSRLHSPSSLISNNSQYILKAMMVAAEKRKDSRVVVVAKSGVAAENEPDG